MTTKFYSLVIAVLIFAPIAWVMLDQAARIYA
jgi:hypothetical protein